MVILDPVYRIEDIKINIFGAIINNYSDGFCDYDFSRMMLSKFRDNAINLSKRIDDGGNFIEDINDAYNNYCDCLDIIKEKKAI